MGPADGTNSTDQTGTDPGSGAEAVIEVLVVLAPAPRQVLQCPLRLPAGSTALQALQASGLAQGLDAGLLDALQPSIWGRTCALDAVLQQGDRLAWTRPLQVDPKEARRLRYQRDGLRRPPRPQRVTADPPVLPQPLTGD